MCGLVGVAGDVTTKWKEVFTDLLIVDSVRGMHGTGAAAIKRYESRVQVVKAPGPSHLLIMTEEYQKLLKEPLKCLIGHNRYATVGGHTAENSHPFAFEHVVGAHNGTLEKWSTKRLHDNEKYGTDSEALFANMNQYGLPATVDKLEGAWALTWYDQATDSINFLRNEKRPLYYTYSRDRCTLLWASEIGMLEFVLRRAKEPFEVTNCYYVDEDQHLSWVLPKTINDKFTGPYKKECKAPPSLASAWESGPYANWREEKKKYGTAYGASAKSSSGSNNTVVPFPNGGTSTSIRPSTKHGTTWKVEAADKFRPPYKDNFGKIYNKKAFNELIADGCAYCDKTNINWGEFIKPIRDFDGKSVFLCKSCYVDPEINEICKALL